MTDCLQDYSKSFILDLSETGLDSKRVIGGSRNSDRDSHFPEISTSHAVAHLSVIQGEIWECSDRLAEHGPTKLRPSHSEKVVFLLLNTANAK